MILIFHWQVSLKLFLKLIKLFHCSPQARVISVYDVDQH